MRIKLTNLFALLTTALLLLSFGAQANTYKTVEGDPLKARIYTLDNGLKVYMAVNKEEPRIQTFIAVRVGAKNDPAQTTGLAHYFEHLMFKGTKQFGTQDYAQEKVLLDQIEAQFEIYRTKTDEVERTAIYAVIDSLSYEASKLSIPNEYDKVMSTIGATGSNAYTGQDMTVYIENIPSNQIENWAKIQSDRFTNNVIRGFHTELETVYEEKNMSLTSDSRKIYETVLSSLFNKHPYGTQTVLGTQEHLKNPSITAIKNFFNEWYVPNNMAICLSGDFDPTEMITIIKRYFGDMKPNHNLKYLDIVAEDPITTPIVKTVLGLEAEKVAIAWRTGGVNSSDADKLYILSSILYNGKAGLIDLNIIQQQKALSAYGYYVDNIDHGMMFTQATPKGGQTLDEVKDLILAEITRLKAGDFEEALLEATINNYRASQMQQMDSNGGRANMFVDSFLNDIPWEEKLAQLDRMKLITKADIVELANRLLGDDNYVVVYKREGQDPQEEKIAKPVITPTFANRDASSEFLREIQSASVKKIEPVFLDYSKDIDHLTAKSNIPLLYVPNKTTGIFNMTYVYETGSNNDPMANTAVIYLHYLGTSKMTPEQIKQEFYRIACSFSVSSTAERSYISLVGLSDNMDRAMELLESLIADAQPNPEALESMKSDILKGREDAKLNQNANFRMLQNYALYGPKSPTTNLLSAEELKALSPETLLRKIKSLGSMEHRILYYGPLSQSVLLSKVEQFHQVPRTLEAAPAPKEFPQLTTNVNRVMHAQYDAKQVYYMQVSNRGETYDVANTPRQGLYNEYFGDIAYQEMRETRGLAYSAYAYLGAPSRKDRSYTMVAFIATQNDKLDDAMVAFQEIINNMPTSENSFKLAKEGIIAKIETQRITKNSILWSYINAKDMGLDYDSRKATYEAIQTMTLGDVEEFHKEWIKDRKYTYCILGDSNDIDFSEVSKIAEVEYLSKEQLFGY